MEHIRRIQDFAQLKTLADPRRLTILRLVMARAYTLSQLGDALGLHPAKVRHHLKQLEAAGLVELVDTRVVRGFVEKYYRARARAFALQELILPEVDKPDTLIILGSHDLALELLSEQTDDIAVLTIPVGSLEGLIALRQGSAQIAGCHLLDVESGEYNLPYVRHFFPDRSVTLITLAHREQGLIVAPGNPLDMREVEDICRPGVRCVNRNQGSGTRLWLESRIEALGLPAEVIERSTDEVHTHTRLAEIIARGEADVGLGLRAAAQQQHLDFVPLFRERYDLVIPQEHMEDQNLAALLDHLQSGAFRRSVSHLNGYDTGHTGEQIAP